MKTTLIDSLEDVPVAGRGHDVGVVDVPHRDGSDLDRLALRAKLPGDGLEIVSHPYTQSLSG